MTGAPNRGPERMAGARNEGTRIEIGDRMHDNLFQLAGEHENRLKALEKAIGAAGAIPSGALFILILEHEAEAREFALMVGGEW